MKLSLKNGGKVKVYSDKGRLREFIPSRLVRSPGTLEGVKSTEN